MAADPLYQFMVRPLIPFQAFGWDLSFTNAALFMLLAAIVPVIFFAFALHPQRLIPGRFQCFGEIIYEFFANLLDSTSGERGKPFFPFVFSIFIFVLMGNLLGMLPYAFTFTSQIIITFGLAMLVFCVVTLAGIIKHKGKFFSLFFPSGAPLMLAPILIPIELLSYLSRPVSLSIRLFANMMAGHTMLKVFAGFTVALGFLGVAPLAINIALTAFEFLVAILQAYVFTILTCLYLHDALYLH